MILRAAHLLFLALSNAQETLRNFLHSIFLNSVADYILQEHLDHRLFGVLEEEKRQCSPQDMKKAKQLI